MKEHLSRRGFFSAVGAGALVGLALTEAGRYIQAYDPDFKIFFDGDNEHLSFSECAQLARRFDKLYDSLPESRPSMTQKDLQEWAMEVIPMFEYEGFVAPTRWPEKDGVGFLAFASGNPHNHVLGRSNCGSYAALNFRVANEHSSWFQDDDTVTAFIHELAHVQQGAECAQSTQRVENTAQIMMLEVSSALVNQGNKEVLPSLISELRGMALSSAYAAALTDNNLQEYTNLRGQLSPGAVSRAKFEKSARRWSRDQAQLRDILNWYNVQPLLMIMNAIRFNHNNIDGLALSPEQFYQSGGMIFHQTVDTYRLDDLAYFLTHAEEIVADSQMDWPPKL